MKKVVTIGGGTGTSSLLRGLKNYTNNLTAIVAVSDDGGGSGILRRDMGILPPGDIRNCLSALANTEPTMEKLLEYRFNSGNLEGQNFGNILIAALCDIYGGFDVALDEISTVLNITGKVLPVTLENIHLVAEFENKEKCIGESIIPKMSYKLQTKIERISIFPETPKANKKALDDISEADLIIFGPGSLYTSIIPNLVVCGIPDAIKNSKATKIYVPNIMTQKGETIGYSVLDHIRAIEEHSYFGIFDYVLMNEELVSENLLNIYNEKDKTTQILITNSEKDELEDRGIKVVKGDFLLQNSNRIRHSGDKISKTLKNLQLL